jgi:hypothetical protein
MARCIEMAGCNRVALPGQRGCVLHAPIEQPRCTGCGHRRIFHFVGRGTPPGRGVPDPKETPTRCMVDTDNPERRACGCDEYRAQELAHAR